MPKILFQIAIILLLGQFVSPAKAKIMISVDIDKQRMKVTNNNGATFWWTISSGREGFETPTGSFSVQRLDANHFSDEYEQAPMPYAIFFHEGFAIHGTYQGGLGRPVSHGCVRLAVPNARLLYSWVEQYGASIDISGSTSADDYFVSDTPAKGRSTSRSNRSWITIFPAD